MRRGKKLSKRMVVSLLMSLAVIGNIGGEAQANEFAPVPTLSQLHNSGAKIPDTNITYPQSTYSISEGSQSDYNFSIPSYDSEGNLTNNYYKINLEINKLGPDGITWKEVSTSGQNTVTINLPNNEIKYYQYTYKNPEYYVGENGNYINTEELNILDRDFIDSQLSNKGTIKNLTSNFISSHVSAIYNTGYIENIVGDFISNSNNYDVGGAIYNNEHSNIKNVIGDFINNTALFGGGAIYNNNSIENITGNFINNSSNRGTGAIDNRNGIAIGSIKGNFINNSGGDSTGAINNGGNIGNITGNFIANYTTANSTHYGASGAILNNGQIKIVNSNFYNNYVKTLDRSGEGGAIYTTKDLNIIADNGTSTFKGNYTDINGTIDDNAIYVKGADTNLTLNTKNNGEIFMHDNIRGTDGYNVNITGDNTGILHLYNNINNAYVTTNNIIIDMVDNNIRNYRFKELKSAPSTKYIIDVDLADSGSADTITAGNPSTGIVYDSTVTLSDINIMNSDSATGDNYKIQILKTESNDFQLALGNGLVDKEFILRNTETETVTDEIKKDAKWDDKFETYNINTSVVGKVSLDTTDTTNDSINFNATGTKTTKTDNVSLGDTLALVNQLETEEDRSFSFDTAGDKYNVSQDLGKTTSGTMSINGVAEENSRSEINLNGHQGFEITNNSTLNLNNIKILGNDTLINVDNPNAVINLQNANLDGNINSESSYTLNINGSNSDKTTISGNVGAANATLSDGEISMGADTFKDANFTTLDGTVNLVTGKTENYNIGTLNSNENTNWTFDIDTSGESPTSDTLTVGSGSNGTVKVSEINFVNGDTPNESFTVQMLNSSDDQIQLGLDPAVSGENYRLGTTSKSTSDTVSSTVKYNDEFYKHTQYGTNYGSMNLATTNTTNDSLELKVTGTEWDDEIINTSMGDTLALVNQLETSEDRNFNFDTSDDVYELSSDLGTTSAGTFNINGVYNPTPEPEISAKRSTINGNNYNMFVLSNPTTLNLNNVKVTGANSVASGTNREAAINLNNVELKDNKSGITTAGDVNISGKSVFENNGNGIEVTSEESIITLNGLDGDGYDITFKDKLSGVAGAKLNLKAGTVEFHKPVSNLDVSMDNTTANLKADNVFNEQNLSVVGVSNINMVNNSIGTMQLNSFTLNDNLNLGVDVDIANKSMDRISANTYNLGGHKVNVNQMNLLSDSKEVRTDIQFADEGLKNNVTTSVSEVAYSPIYKYGVNYNKNNGEFEFTRSYSGGVKPGEDVPPPSYSDLNPSVMVSPVAAQLGGYTSLLDTYSNAFNNMDVRMLMPSSYRLAQEKANQYAISDGSGSYERNAGGVWVRPYTSYDSVGLKNGPKVHNTSYGTFIGGDSGLLDIGKGLTGVFSTHISYNGSHQSFGGNSIYQNGGNVGLTGTLYKGNFFTGLTAAVGASLADASTMYGNEDFPMLTTGVASKTGYNLEFKEGKFIIQSSLMVSYSFVNNFDYTNAAGVRIDAQPLHAVQISPNIRFSFNTKRGWQPYLTAGMNWNIMNNDGRFMANQTALPELSVKPYVQYGAGIQKIVSDDFTAFAQFLLRNGGRNGIAATAGMRYLFGRTNSNNAGTKHTL